MRRLGAGLLLAATLLAVTAGLAGAQDVGPPPNVAATTSTTIPPGADTYGGMYPPSAYTVRGKTDVSKPDMTFYTTAARGFFDAALQVNTLTMAATLWVWKYDLVPALTPLVATMADVTQQHVVGRFGLVHFALLILGVYIGFLLLKGRLVHGVGEFALSVASMLVAGWIALNPVAFFTGSTTLMREVSTAMTASDSGQAGDQALTGNLQRGLIHDPWEWLSFGHVIDGTKCADAAQVALAPKQPDSGGIIAQAKDAAGKAADLALKGVVGPGVGVVEDAAVAAGNLTFKSGTDGDVSKKLDDLDCPVEKAAYENPSGSKVFGAFMLLVASLVVAALALTVDIAVIVAQAVFALLAVTAPLAVVAAILPGPIRELWWRWLAAAAKAFVAVVAGCYLLAIVLGFIGGVLTVGPADTIPMELRMMAIVAIPIVAFLFRKKIVGGAAHIGSRGVARAGTLAPSSNAVSLHAATAGTASAAMGVMGADPNYSLRQQGREAVAVGQRALRSRTGRATIAAATGGAGAAATAAVGLRGAAMRTATRIAWSKTPRPGQPNPDVDDVDGGPLELTPVAGRTRPLLALSSTTGEGRFTMPPQPGDAAPRSGALPAGSRPAKELNAGPPAPTPRPRRRRRDDAEADTHPAGYHIETRPAPAEVVYHPDARSAQTQRLNNPAVVARWDHAAEQRVLRHHERFHREGRDRPLTLDEIDPTMPAAQRRRVRDLSSTLWEDEAVATHLAGRGVLRIAGSSAEERHWIRGADFTQADQMSKLRGYHADGRLRLKGHGPVPADEHLHQYAHQVYGNRPLP